MTDTPSPVCKWGHPLDPAKKGQRCPECRREKVRRNRRKRKAQWEAKRCGKGHDLSLPGAVVFKGQGSRSGKVSHWSCVACSMRGKAGSVARRGSTVGADPARLAAEIDPTHNYTGAATERLLQLSRRLETAMPWERADLKREIDRLAGIVDLGIDPLEDGREDGAGS